MDGFFLYLVLHVPCEQSRPFSRQRVYFREILNNTSHVDKMNYDVESVATNGKLDILLRERYGIAGLCFRLAKEVLCF